MTSLLYLARRIGAYLIDCVVLFSGVLLSQGLIYALGLNPIVGLMNSGAGFSGWQLHGWVFASVSVPFALYYALCHASPWQATLGKRWLGLRVMRVDGQAVTLGPALLRAAITLIPFEWNHTVLFHLAPMDGLAPSAWFWMGYAVTYLLVGGYVLSVLLSAQRQSPADFVSGLLVSTLNSVK